jgi:hypothetical protein
MHTFRSAEIRAEAARLIACAERNESSQAFTGRAMECGHCGHTITEHEDIDRCAECDREGAEFTCADFDH